MIFINKIKHYKYLIIVIFLFILILTLIFFIKYTKNIQNIYKITYLKKKAGYNMIAILKCPYSLTRFNLFFHF